MISKLERDQFFEQGLLGLRGFLTRTQTAKARERILTELSRLKLRVGGKYRTSELKKMPVFQQTTFLSGQVQAGNELDRLFTPELFKTITELADSNLIAQHPHPQLLLSLPQNQKWSVQNLGWHLDYKNSRMDILPGVQVFVLIEDVKPRGGATLALTGSHRLHKILPGQNAHGVLKQNSEFTESPEKFLEPRDLHGVPVQIVEMSGHAGDVFLMDLRVLHTPSINSQSQPRMMTTNRFLKPGLKL